MSQTARMLVFFCLFIIYLSTRCLSATHEMFNCSSDFCNRYDTDQFCSPIEKRCRDCSTIRDDCHSLQLPGQCTSWCIKYNAEQAVQKAKAQHCTLLEDILNGRHNVSDGDHIRPGDVVDVTCNEGFKVKGKSILTCRDYGQWSNDVPKCEAVTCSMPPTIENGVWTPNSITDVSFGTKLTVKCNQGYSAKEIYTLTCSKTGTWTEFGNRNMPVCLEARQLNVWMILAVSSWIALPITIIVCCYLRRYRRKCHRRKKQKKMFEQQKQKMASSALKEDVNESKTPFTNDESKHLLNTENDPQDTISIQQSKQLRSKVVVSNSGCVDPNPLPNLINPNDPIKSVNIEAGQGASVQLNFNHTNGNNNTVKNETSAVTYSDVNRSKENEKDDKPDETEQMVIEKAEKMPVEEAATSATAQPEQSNECKINIDVAGQTVVCDKPNF